MNIVRRTLAVVAALSVLACGNGDEALVVVNYFDAPRLPRNLLSVTVSDGARTRVLRLDHVGAPGQNGREFATRLQGNLRVAFRFAASGVIVSEGEATVPLRTDWRYGFDIRVDSLNPTRACFGCIGARAFPLAVGYQRTARDSVWLIWSGNNIRNPGIF